ncbi:uncharacterized protein LOC128863757 [Anastrepha ludens]|uniref:uncharacterized protein LOC128863757 n=1 Tax=Anastrepha ludens TaxID=28586 RepID=UPI0023B052FF|nr:uncharacterized protein LOC128863757 [Anastrepha ludens]
MGRHKNVAQEAIMVDFMKEYLDLARGTLQNKDVRNALWAMLADKLNNRGPPSKPPERWKKVWFDWRAAVKRKIMYERNEAHAAEQDEIPYKKTSLSPVEYDVARICGFFDDDADIDKGSDMQEDLSTPSEGVANIIKEELMLDEENDENPIDSHVAIETFKDQTNEKPSEVERISVRSFALCQSTASKRKVEAEKSEGCADAKKRNIRSPETEGTEKLFHLVKQQTTVINTVSQFLNENADLHAENLRVMKEISEGLKQMCESINKLSEATNDKLKEQRRHNYEIEKLRREEILLKKQQLELNEFKVFGKE